MNIKINHIAKMEGHAGFMASVLQGDVKSAKLEVQEGIRLIEGVLIGRHFRDVPVVAQRICGICPIVHNLTAVKAVEKALGVKVTEEAVLLRTAMELAQIIHSHALHLYFLSLADFLDIENDLVLAKEYPAETKKAIRIREFGMDVVRIIGGRVIHPLTNEVGGFKKIPDAEALRVLAGRTEEILRDAESLGELFIKLKLPEFSRETEYVALGKNGDYAIYDGDVRSSKGLHIPVEKFETDFQELQKQREVIKKVTHDGGSYMVGAIARLNINHEKLNPRAKAFVEKAGLSFLDFNPFHNILAQMAEVIHAVEQTEKILKQLLHVDLSNAITREYETKAGIGIAAVEAPRGTLYYHVELDDKGYVKNLNIITPTAQFLVNLEDDIAAFIEEKGIAKLPEKEREKKLRGFIRAYDPCISCAVH